MAWLLHTRRVPLLRDSRKAPKSGAAQPSGDSATMGGTRKAAKTGAAQPSGDSPNSTDVGDSELTQPVDEDTQKPSSERPVNTQRRQDMAGR